MAAKTKYKWQQKRNSTPNIFGVLANGGHLRKETRNSQQFFPKYSPKSKKVCKKLKKCSKDGKLWKVDCRKKTKREKMPKKLSLIFQWGDVKHTKLKQLKLFFLPLKTTKLLFPYPHESFQKADWLPFGLQFVYYSMEWNPEDVTSLHHVIDYVTNVCRTHVSLKTKRFLVQNYFCQLWRLCVIEQELLFPHRSMDLE